MKRTTRRWWAVCLAGVVLVGAGLAVWQLWFGGDDAAAARYLTTSATTGTVAESVEADCTLVKARADMSLSTATSGIVTSVNMSLGSTPKTLQRLLTLSGEPVFAFVSSTPLYADLSYGSEGTNVRVLERALKRRGYSPGEIDGTFDADTQDALLDWQEDANVDQTGTLSADQFVWIAKGSVVSSLSVVKGSSLGQGGAFATVSFPRRLKAEAAIGQADIDQVEIGQTATLTIDGHEDDTVEATVVSIADETSASATGSTSSTVSYTVVFELKSLPSYARVGMTGALTITIESREDVLVVPTSAVVGTSSQPLVRLLKDDSVVYRQVETGLATASLTEIVSGLAAGEKVVTGEITEGSTTTSGSSGSLLGGSVQGAGMDSGTRPTMPQGQPGAQQ